MANSPPTENNAIPVFLFSLSGPACIFHSELDMNMHLTNLRVLVAASLLMLSACSKKAGSESESEVILTDKLAPAAAPAETVKAEVKIAGVTHEEEVSLIDLLHVTGLLTQGTQQVAVINGEVVGMGEDMHLEAGGKEYTLQVLSITDTSIRLKATHN